MYKVEVIVREVESVLALLGQIAAFFARYSPVVQVVHLQVEVLWCFFWFHGWVNIDPNDLDNSHLLAVRCIAGCVLI